MLVLTNVFVLRISKATECIAWITLECDLNVWFLSKYKCSF